MTLDRHPTVTPRDLPNVRREIARSWMAVRAFTLAADMPDRRLYWQRRVDQQPGTFAEALRSCARMAALVDDARLLHDLPHVEAAIARAVREVRCLGGVC